MIHLRLLKTLYYTVQLIRFTLLLILTLLIITIFIGSVILGILHILILYKYIDTKWFGEIRRRIWVPYESLRTTFNTVWTFEY